MNLEKIEMKENLVKAIFIAVVTAIGITMVMLMKGENFSLFKTGLYAVIAFVVDYIFSYIFDKRNSKF